MRIARRIDRGQIGARGLGVVFGLHGHAAFQQVEAVDQTVESVHRVIGLDVAEPGCVQAAQRGIDERQHVGPHIDPSHDQRRRPRMRKEHRPHRVCAAAHLVLPDAASARQVDAPHDGIDHRVQQIVLVADMVVKRHRLHPQLPSQSAHAQAFHAACIGQRKCHLGDPGAGQAGSAGWFERLHGFKSAISIDMLTA